MDAGLRAKIGKIVLALRNNSLTAEEFVEELGCLVVIGDWDARELLLTYVMGVAAGFGDNIHRISNEVATYAERAPAAERR